jgi:diamine N-acetyltransferase
MAVDPTWFQFSLAKPIGKTSRLLLRSAAFLVGRKRTGFAATMTTRIIGAKTEDTAIVALLGRITFPETFVYLFPSHAHELSAYLDTTFGVAKIRTSLGKPGNAYWLALRDRLPVGYAKLKHPSALPFGQAGKDAAQLQKIYVLNEFLGEGIGKALMQQTLAEARWRAPILWLDVLHENKRAIGFYEKHGFTVTGEDAYTIGSQTFRFVRMTTCPT